MPQLAQGGVALLQAEAFPSVVAADIGWRHVFRRGLMPAATVCKGLLRIWIGTENAQELAVLAQFLEHAGELAVFGVAFAIDEEKVFPRFALVGARLDLGHVDLIPAEGRKRVVQRAGLMRNAEHNARAIVARRRSGMSAEHEKASDVRGVVLDVSFENAEVVTLRGQRAGDCGGV